MESDFILWHHCAEAYLAPCQTSVIESVIKKVNGLNQLIFLPRYFYHRYFYLYCNIIFDTTNF